jgi:DNA-binding MarR family transcriptional regulator/transcriptional regulator with XRE-family HTH domain
MGRRIKVKPLKTWRIEKGYTGDKLAQAAGVAPSLISKIEHGARTNFQPDTMKKIVDVLGVSLHDISEFYRAIEVSVDVPVYPEKGPVRLSRPKKKATNGKVSRQITVEPNGEVRDSVDNLLGEWTRSGFPVNVELINVIFRIQRLNQYIEAGMDEWVAPTGIKNRDYMVIAALKRSGPPYSLTPTQLFKALLITSGAITKRLDNLENMGLIKRTHDANDRRSILVSLTEKGHALDEKARNLSYPLEEWTTNALTEEEYNSLVNCLRKMLHKREHLDS